MEKGSVKTCAEKYGDYWNISITATTVLLLFQLARYQSSACETTNILCVHMKICFNVNNNKYITIQPVKLKTEKD